MRVVGLTGGISSGKSTISNLFKSNGIPVVDADIVARNVVLKGTGGWKKIKKEFGDDVLLESGDIDRARLGQIVFSDPEKRQLLNRYSIGNVAGLQPMTRASCRVCSAFIHVTRNSDLCSLLAPHISSGIIWEVIKLWFKGCRVIILDIPLLFETKMNLWTKPVIVVWVDPETQIQRLIARDGISEEQARNRIEAQMPLDLKREKADLVIDNSGSLEETKVQFEQVLSQVKSPLSLKESVFSRDGFISVLLSVVVGVIVIKKNVS